MFPFVIRTHPYSNLFVVYDCVAAGQDDCECSSRLEESLRDESVSEPAMPGEIYGGGFRS